MLTGGMLNSISQTLGLNVTFARGGLGGILSGALLLFFPIAGSVVLVFILIGGYKLMMSGGDPKKVQEGKTILTQAIIGFLIIFASYWIVQALGYILGIAVFRNIFS